MQLPWLALPLWLAQSRRQREAPATIGATERLLAAVQAEAAAATRSAVPEGMTQDRSPSTPQLAEPARALLSSADRPAGQHARCARGVTWCRCAWHLQCALTVPCDLPACELPSLPHAKPCGQAVFDWRGGHVQSLVPGLRAVACAAGHCAGAGAPRSQQAAPAGRLGGGNPGANHSGGATAAGRAPGGTIASRHLQVNCAALPTLYTLQSSPHSRCRSCSGAPSCSAHCCLSCTAARQLGASRGTTCCPACGRPTATHVHRSGSGCRQRGRGRQQQQPRVLAARQAQRSRVRLAMRSNIFWMACSACSKATGCRPL